MSCGEPGRFPVISQFEDVVNARHGKFLETRSEVDPWTEAGSRSAGRAEFGEGSATGTNNPTGADQRVGGTGCGQCGVEFGE